MQTLEHLSVATWPRTCPNAIVGQWVHDLHSRSSHRSSVLDICFRRRRSHRKWFWFLLALRVNTEITMQASNCDRCYRRKGRCDKLQPCSSCQKASVRCEYTDKIRQRRFTSDEVDRIEKRLRQAEARNRSLADELSKATRSPVAGESGTSPAETSQSRSSGQQRRADAVSEVSYLSINAAGERQYLGSTSGLLFADLVRSSVDASVSRHATPPSGSADEDTPAATVCHSRYDHRKLSDLPGRPLVNTLISAYMEHDAIAFPL